jgi:hypothetical protein
VNTETCTLNPAFLLLLSLTQDYSYVDEPIRSVMFSPQTFWYDKQTLPRVYQHDNLLWPLGYNVSATGDRSGSPNNEKPWLHTGGMDDVKEGFVKRFYWSPAGKRVKIWRTYGSVSDNQGATHLGISKWVGEFPIGAIVGEILMDGKRDFEVRARRKVALGEWEHFQFEKGPKPRGYISVRSCVDCHNDVTKDANELDGSRDWYGQVGSLEQHGPIHLHFFNYRGVTGAGTALTFNDALKHLYEVIDRKNEPNRTEAR